MAVQDRRCVRCGLPWPAKPYSGAKTYPCRAEDGRTKRHVWSAAYPSAYPKSTTA